MLIARLVREVLSSSDRRQAGGGLQEHERLGEPEYIEVFFTAPVVISLFRLCLHLDLDSRRVHGR